MKSPAIPTDQKALPGSHLPGVLDTPQAIQQVLAPWLKLLGALAICLLLPLASLADRLPNIVLLIGDDHGYPYFGFMGDEHVVTPSMDALAEGGVTFTQGMVTTPYCRPSLRAMVTGLHPVEYQLALNRHIEQRKTEDEAYSSLTPKQQRMWTQVEKAKGMQQFDTLPKLLRQKGYKSWQGGKWWEGSYKNGGFDEGMTAGWDMSVYGTDEFFHEMMGAEGNDLVRETMAPLYDFIDRHADDPLFIWFGPMLPHTPLDAPYRYYKFYEHKDITQSAKRYYANITWWDEGVSQLMDYMEAKGLMEDTLFIYLSDNGWEQDAQVEYWYPEADKDFDSEWLTGGYGGKGALQDLSLRTPIIFYWKGQLEPGFNHKDLVSSLDLVPTLIDMLGLEAEGEYQGLSLMPLLHGGKVDQPRHLIAYSDNRRSPDSAMGAPAEGYAVRTPDWHFLWYADTDEMRLYNVRKDPRGMVNLAGKQRKRVQQMQQQIADWKQQVGLTGRLEIHE